jgi:hypothetical protein
MCSDRITYHDTVSSLTSASTELVLLFCDHVFLIQYILSLFYYFMRKGNLTLHPRNHFFHKLSIIVTRFMVVTNNNGDWIG